MKNVHFSAHRSADMAPRYVPDVILQPLVHTPNSTNEQTVYSNCVQEDSRLWIEFKYTASNVTLL